MNNNSSPKTWSKLKTDLFKYTQSELLDLICKLYTLSSDNKRFIEAMVVDDSNIIEQYRNIISKNISTEAPWKKSQQLSLKTAKKAISDYKKATNNINGTVNLMIYYIERGTEFTCAFGDIDENFYYSLESMFENILKLINTHNIYELEFINRLDIVVHKARHIGWGYYDSIKDMFDEWKNLHKHF